jgi:hypothetical protein
MNTSTNTNQTHDTTKITARTTPTGFRRRTMAGTLLVMALTATAVGFAATSHADTGEQTPDIDTTISVPAPAADWLRPIFGHGYPHLDCTGSWHGHSSCHLLFY